MGMPISSYSVLHTLAYGRSGFEKRSVERALSPFNLFAFVIHDPTIHSEFDHFLEQGFDRLDYDSGANLLFFALVRPSQNWLSHAHGRSYYRSLSKTSWESLELTNPGKAPVSDDYSATAFSLANTLKISTNDLPCIVITSDFRLGEFQWLRTSSNHLSLQLRELGFFAARNSDFSIRSPKFQDLARDLESQPGTLDVSLAKILSDILSFVVAGGKDAPYLKKTALSQAKAAIHKVMAEIKTLKRQSYELVNDELENLCVLCVSYLAQLSEDGTETDTPNLISAVNRKLLEDDSFTILRTAEKVSTLLKGGQFRDIIPDAAISNSRGLDYTPGVICLAKVFEKEINLSVVHWVRKKLGISLPQFFNLPQAGVRAKIVPNLKDGRAIDFNMGRAGKWLAPGIGQSELACVELSNHGIPDEFDRTSWDILMEIWKTVRKERNEAAHTNVVGFESLTAIRDALTKMFSERFLDKCYSMKQRYRGLPEARTAQ